MDHAEYKKFHEEHMINNTGTSVEESVILLSTVPLCVFLSSFLSFWISKSVNYIFEFFIIIVPVTLSCTILSDFNYIIFLSIVLLCIFIIIKWTDGNTFKNLLSAEVKNEKSFITNYRACTNFVSAICILAVDFIIFPKRLAKTESFGFGFMDLGVGFFICSNGFVEKHTLGQVQFNKLLKTELTLCALGLIRMFTIKSIDYHEHVSEYGTHWNFFFTLALCRLISYFIVFVTNDAKPFYLCITTGFIHQLLLLFGLQQWVLSNIPRDSFLNANREGFVSCLGYICLYFGSSSIGKYVLHLKNSVYKVLIKKLFFLCIFMWLLTVISVKVFDISRRLVNVSFIFWILALSLTELILFIILEISLLSLKRKSQATVFSTMPRILKCINAHGLFFFILSNLLTGLINFIFQTLLVGKLMSMIIIVSYMIILCSATNFLFLNKNLFNYKIVGRKKKKAKLC